MLHERARRISGRRLAGPFGHPAFLILQTTVGSYPYRTAVVRELFDHSWHLEHERAHDYAASESRGDTLIMRDLRVYSRALGITGACDVVEFHKSNDGVPLHGRDGLWLPYPIEYKHGKSKTIDADRLQLCAEAMCLEEMLACDIPEGALFYRQTKRRERVKLDEDLRNMVEADFLQMHDLFSRGWTPKVKQTRSCSSCSLRDLCLPELRKVKSAKAYIEERLKESGE